MEVMSQGYELPDGMLSWTIEKSEKWHVEDAELATTQLMLIMAAIHTTTMTTTHM
jgi:endo-1,4-beta-D-glucanase Y